MKNIVKNVHMMGIGGSGMAGVAMLASKMGYNVTGCDLESQTAYGKNIFKGHSPGHLKDTDLLVITPAVFYQNSKNPELVTGQKKGIVLTWQEFLGRYLQKGKKVICVAGTHGKSTTTAMAGKLLEDAGLDPLVLVGANVPWWGGNARYGKGKYFVCEADEFNDNFLNYSPEIIVLNNIEFDHPDFFKNEKQVFESFKKFVGRLVGMKILVVNKDAVGVQKLLGMIDVSELKIIGYSPKSQKLGFDLLIPGKHNVANALGVVALGKFLGISEVFIKKSLSDFSGVGRRMELIADLPAGKAGKNGVKVYDDYAHHPTAIAATLQGIRDLYPKSKIWAIDEPHGYKRTKALLPKYKGVFDSVDKVIIGPIFQARDKKDLSVTPQKVAKISEHPNALGVDSFDEIIENCKLEIGNYDVVVVMGAGKSYLWAREIASLLR
jgi:UDP-N-acetylmuramate--alanine ligase